MDLSIELLQVALGTRDRLSKVPKHCEWVSLYDESVRQSVVGVMMGGIECLPEEQLPSPELKFKWIGADQTVESSTKVNGLRSGELVDLVNSAGSGNCSVLPKSFETAMWGY